jgi:hypothetical protein
MHPSWPGGTLLLSIVEPGDNPWKWVVENLTEEAGETNAVAALVPDASKARRENRRERAVKSQGHCCFFVVNTERWYMAFSS